MRAAFDQMEGTSRSTPRDGSCRSSVVRILGFESSFTQRQEAFAHNALRTSEAMTYTKRLQNHV
jgi:hypothetical protein